MRKLIFVFLVFLNSSILFSQKIWTLEECISYAQENNIQIKQQKIASLLAKYQYDQSIAMLFPSLNASASHVYNNGQTVDMYTNQFANQTVQSNNFYLSSSVVLFNGLQLLNGLKQKQFDFLASTYDLQKMKNDIALTITTAYLQILYNTELLQVAKNQLELSQQQLERSQKMLEAEVITQGTLLFIESQKASDELQYVNAQNQLEMAYLTLTQLLDLQSRQGFDIEKPNITIPESSSLTLLPEEIFDKAVTVQPEIKSAELKVKSAQKGFSIAKGMLSPSLALNASYGTGYSGASKKLSDFTLTGYAPIGFTQSGEMVYGPTYEYTYEKIGFWKQLDQNLNSSVGLYLNIPIFNKWQTQTSIRSSKLMLDNAELSLQNSKNNLFKTIQQAYADALAALNKYNASIKNVEAYSESYKYAEQKFNVGLINFIDYNDAKNKLASAKSEMLRSKYEYIFRLKVLDFYQGKPLTLK